MANRKTSQLTEVTTLPDNAKIYAVDESRAVGDRSVQIDKSNLIPAGVESIIAGTNVTVDATDPANPIVNSTGADVLPQPITTASTNYTLVEADIKAWTPYRFTGNNIVITIPAITFEEFIVINMQHTGTGTVTIQSGAGVTFPDQTFTTDKAFSIASYADDVWDIYSLEIEQGTALTGQTFTGAIALDNTLSTYYNTYDLSVSGTPTFSVSAGAVTSGRAYIIIDSDGVTPFATKSNIDAIFNEQYSVPVDYILSEGLHRLYILKTANGVSIESPTNVYNPDIVAPTVSTATIEDANPDQLVVVFNESVNITNTTGLSLDGDLIAITVDSILSGSGTDTITFQLSASATGGDAGNFVYSGTNTIEDLTGNSLVAGSTDITNNLALIISNFEVTQQARNIMAVTFSSNITALTNLTDFTISVNVGSALTINAFVHGIGTSVLYFELSRDIIFGDDFDIVVGATNTIFAGANQLSSETYTELTNGVPEAIEATDYYDRMPFDNSYATQNSLITLTPSGSPLFNPTIKTEGTHSLEFTGSPTSQRVVSDYKYFGRTNNFTISVDVYFPAITNGSSVFVWQNNTTNAVFGINKESTTNFRFNGVERAVDINRTIAFDTWIKATYDYDFDNKVLTAYDSSGVVIGASYIDFDSKGDVVMALGNRTLQFGGNNAQPLYMDNFIIYHRLLSEEEMTGLSI